ncbi:MAG: hypothetical protein ABSD76_07810 [Terriglobales bacterium]|jgi:hypothetical protein
MTTETQLPVLEFSALPLSTPVEADKLAGAANLTPAETTGATLTEEQLYAEIARLWAANKVNRYDLGEKLWQLKQQAKHGEWMTKVQHMGIPQRTVNSLMEYYREEFMRRTTPAITDADFEDAPSQTDAEDEQQEEKPASERKTAVYFRPHITLNWGAEEKAWKRAIEVIVIHTHVHNATDAAFFAVVEMAKKFESLEQQEIEATGVGSQAASSVELAATEPSVLAPVTVAPAPILENVIKPVPVPVPSLQPTPRKPMQFVSDENEEVQ